MAAATQNTDETLASTDEQATTKQKNTRNKTNKTTETQNTQAGDEKASDQGDLLNSQGPEDGASQDEGNKPTDLKMAIQIMKSPILKKMEIQLKHRMILSNLQMI